MSNALIEKYTEERAALADLVDNTLGRVDAEERDLVPAEIESLESAKARMIEIDAQLATIKDTLERRGAALDMSHLIHKAAARETASVQVNEPQRRVPSLGDFVDSPQYRGFGFAGSSDRAIMDMRLTETRGVLSTTTEPVGSVFIPQPAKMMIPQGLADFPLLGVCNRVPVSGNSIDMVVYGSPKGATGATKVAEGSQKPEATLTASSVPVTLETWAYYVEVTRQLLQDAPAARSFIDEQLRTGLMSTLEKDVSDTIGAATIDATTGGAGDGELIVIRQAMATVQAKGFRPNAILASPAVAAEIDLTLMGRTLNGAVAGVNPWGLTVIPVAGLTKTYVGDFQKGVALLERTGIEVFITDSGITGSGAQAKDRFTNNIFAILAETRAKAVVVQPDALTEVKLTPAP
jgi:HK97 family phage major capsid protein